MATKRKLEATQQHNNLPAPPHKKQRIEKGPPSSKIFQDVTKDQQQYKKIFTAIYDSECIQNYKVPSDIVKQIAEFSTGEFYECCKDNCKEDVSFLWKDINDTQDVDCVHCETKLYWHFCTIHNKYCTSIKDSGPRCETCLSAVCHDCIKDCVNCGKRNCVYCISTSRECKICVQNGHLTSTRQRMILTFL